MKEGAESFWRIKRVGLNRLSYGRLGGFKANPGILATQKSDAQRTGKEPVCLVCILWKCKPGVTPCRKRKRLTSLLALVSLVPLAGIELATFALRMRASRQIYALTDLNKP